MMDNTWKGKSNGVEDKIFSSWIIQKRYFICMQIQGGYYRKRVSSVLTKIMGVWNIYELHVLKNSKNNKLIINCLINIFLK